MKLGWPTRLTQDLGIELISLVNDGTTRKAAAARMARRDRSGGGLKVIEAVTRGLLMAALRWRWVVRPRALALMGRPAGWIIGRWPGRRAGIGTGAQGFDPPQ